MTIGHNMKIYKLVLSALLIIAILPFPYAYYQFLRVAVFVGMVAFTAIEHKIISSAVAVYIVIGIIFNPIYPIYLERDVWLCIDLIIASVLVFMSFAPWNRVNAK